MAAPDKQLLHLVFGGELSKLDTVEFKDLEKLDLVGIYPNYNAHMRYFIVHLHRLLDPESTGAGQAR
jgi:hypothetical protein